MNEWLWAAVALLALLGVLGAVAVRRPFLDGIVALEVAGIDAALVLLLVAEGTHRQPFADLALVLGAMSFVGSVAFVRFAEQEP